MKDTRIKDLVRFYDILDGLEKVSGGKRILSQCSAKTGWPKRGVYFFFENGEVRSDTGIGSRVVRVGTHALTTSSRTTVWQRLSQHRGVAGSGGGNHRGSIFRLLVGNALARVAEDGSVPTWGQGNTASRDIRVSELEHERRVSTTIGQMPLLWLDVGDEPGPQSLRGFIERNSIALLSNYEKVPVDPPSPGWLGNSCDRGRVRRSGLWNQNHVEEGYDAALLDTLESLILQVERPA